MRRAVA